MEQILIVRLGAMGDILHALPAVAALRAARPAARIGWAVEDRWLDLLRVRGSHAMGGTPESPLVDAVHPVNTRGWRSAIFADATWREMNVALRGVRGAGYGVALDLQGALKSALVARLSGAPQVIGYSRPREQAATMLYTRRVETRRAHVVEHAHEVVAAFTGSAGAIPAAQLPHDAASEAWCEQELQWRGLHDFAIINPGAGWGAKLWPAARYAEVCRALGAQRIPSLVNAGPGEQPLAAEVVGDSRGSAQPIECNLAQLIALTRRARIFVGGDTGPMHLAAALQVPVVALFGPTDPARNGPYATRAVVLRSRDSQTSYSHTRQADPGLQSITAEEAIAAARRLLEGAHA